MGPGLGPGPESGLGARLGPGAGAERQKQRPGVSRPLAIHQESQKQTSSTGSFPSSDGENNFCDGKRAQA